MITEDMIIGDVVRKYEYLVPTFLENGLHCIGCPVASQESIKDGCMAHGIDSKMLVEELNKALETKKPNN